MIKQGETGDTVWFKQENGVTITIRFGNNSIEIRASSAGDSLEVTEYGNDAVTCKGVEWTRAQEP